MAGDIVTPSKTVLLDVVALVAASVAASTLTALSLLRQLTELRDEALELARRPPWVMDRLSPGGHLDIEAEVPYLALRADETGRVREAFRMVQRPAVVATLGQAASRRTRPPWAAAPGRPVTAPARPRLRRRPRPASAGVVG